MSDDEPRRAPDEKTDGSQPSRVAPIAGVFPGQYANVVQVGSTQWDFFIDLAVAEPDSFLPLVPGRPIQGTVRPIARILLSPQNMKGVRDALSDAIAAYEDQWGVELPNMKAQPQSD